MGTKQTAKLVMKAIKALDKAADALENLANSEGMISHRGSCSRLKTDIHEYLEYLETSKWWVN